MRVLVTGGAGYIGSILVRKLIENDFDVIALDNLSTGHKESIPASKLITSDLLNKKEVEESFKSQTFQLVIHLAIKSGATTDPYTCIYSNLNSTLNLLECMSNSQARKIIVCSSYEVYGKPDKNIVSEESRINIQSVYAESINMIERFLGWYDLMHGIKAISLRTFCVSGASLDGNTGEDKEEYECVIPNVVKAALGDGVLRLSGADFKTSDGTRILDYVHVDDMADAFIKAIEYLHRSGRSEIFNIGSGIGHSVKEIITEVENQTGKKLNVVPFPKKASEVDAIWADITQARNLLSWEPKFSLSDMIQTAIYWHVKHPNGYGEN